MGLWVRMKDFPSVAFIIPKKNPRDQQLVGFHLSLPMGYYDSGPYFCMSIETVTDTSNKVIAQ